MQRLLPEPCCDKNIATSGPACCLSPVCELSLLDFGDPAHDVAVLLLHSVATVVLVLTVVIMFVESEKATVLMGEAASVDVPVITADGLSWSLGFVSCPGSCGS